MAKKDFEVKPIRKVVTSVYRFKGRVKHDGTVFEAGSEFDGSESLRNQFLSQGLLEEVILSEENDIKDDQDEAA